MIIISICYFCRVINKNSIIVLKHSHSTQTLTLANINLDLLI